MSGPVPAAGQFPYPHRTVFQVDRDNALAMMATRYERERKVRRRNDAARAAIKAGKARWWVMQVFNLSPTAFDQLAGHVRAGWQD